MKGKYDATQTALQHGVMEGLLQGSYDNIHTPKREYYVAKDTLPSTYYKCGDFSTFSFFFLQKGHGWMQIPRAQVATNNIRNLRGLKGANSTKAVFISF